MSFKSLSVLLLSLVCPLCVFGQDATAENIGQVTTANNTKVIYEKHINRLNIALNRDDYTQAFEALEFLLIQLKAEYSERIDAFFPTNMDGFFAVELRNIDDLSVSNEGFGIIFTKRYQNNEGYFLDVNIVMRDPSIAEYLSIINAEGGVEDIQGSYTKKVKGLYDALFSISDEHRFVEVNLILNKSILLNVVFSGSENLDEIEIFLENLDLAGLENFLMK